MAEEFQGEVCGGSWWNSPRTTFMNNVVYGGSGCWQNDFMMNMKTRSSSTDDQSTLLLGGCAAAISPDSAFQMMASSPPSSTTTWNNNHQALLVNGRNEESYNQTLPEISASSNQNSSNFVMDQQQQQTSNFMTSTGDCTGNLVSSSYGYPSNLLQTFFDNTSTTPPEQDQQPLYDDFHANLNDYNPVSSMSGFSSIVKPKQQVLEGLQLANKTPFWSVSAVDSNNHSTQADFYTSTQSRYLSLTNEEKPNCLNTKSQNEDVTNLGSLLKKSAGEPTFKRPRLETPSPLPTFKVRKEKLGDRVTALQQLVSPFGKTDTASVLHEAIDYIKLLHDQVNVLSAPYMKNGATMQRQQIQDKIKNVVTEGAKQDLRSRGLCLVPVSSTFPVATETAPDYWTSGFGSTFK